VRKTTEQEKFWIGKFGDDYIHRNISDSILASNISLFSNILKRTDPISSVIEFGANIGMNLIALKALLPEAEFSAIEINKKAASILEKNIKCDIFPISIMDYIPKRKYDFVLSKGVLIHINPDDLQQVYKSLYESSSRYICIAEYYNPSPMEVVYRGQKGKLFKRDFAGELLDQYKDLELIVVSDGSTDNTEQVVRSFHISQR